MKKLIMKNTLLSNFKQLFVLCLSIGFSVNAEAQEKTKELSSPERSISESVVLEKSEIVTFPIKASKTTDPNYDNNIQKSKETQANFNREPIVVVKDEKYYTKRIVDLKRRIQEIQDNPNSPNVNVDKLGGLSSNLASTEEEYIQYKKSK